MAMKFETMTMFHGPVFDGRALVTVEAAKVAMEHDLAVQGHQMLRTAFHETFKHPTGYYESRVHVSVEHGHPVVTDGGVIYGPWLEGTGSRNYPVTRFKGYANFRKTTQRLQARASVICAITMRRFIGGLNI